MGTGQNEKAMTTEALSDQFFVTDAEKIESVPGKKSAGRYSRGGFVLQVDEESAKDQEAAEWAEARRVQKEPLPEKAEFIEYEVSEDVIEKVLLREDFYYF